MTTTTMSHSEGRALSIARKAARREINAGRARWTVVDGRIVLEPIAPKAKTFGEGLGERHPIHRSPVSLTDMAWWQEESRRAEDREWDILAEIAEADAKTDGWY